MARPGRPERNRAARSFRQLRRFHHLINSDKVFGTHKGSWLCKNAETLNRNRRNYSHKVVLGRLKVVAMRDLVIERTLWQLKSKGRIDIPAGIACEGVMRQSQPA